jgi:hypothetical protein
MVQSLEVAGKLSGNPDTEKENQDFVVAASTTDTKVLCAQDEDMKPFQVTFTKVWFSPSGLLDGGDVYRDKKGSIWSFTSTRGLSREIRDSHSYKSAANSAKSSPSSPPKLAGGLMFGILTIGPRVILGGQLILTG